MNMQRMRYPTFFQWMAFMKTNNARKDYQIGTFKKSLHSRLALALMVSAKTYKVVLKMI